MNEGADQPWPKNCACGPTYDKGAWHALPFGGLWKLDADTWALRHCECKSTIAVDAEHDELSVLGF